MTGTAETAHEPTRTGADIGAFHSAASGDTIFAGTNVFVLVINTDTGKSHTCTVTAVKKCDCGVLHDMVFTIAGNSHVHYCGPIDVPYASTSTGYAALTWSDTTGMSFCAIEMH